MRHAKLILALAAASLGAPGVSAPAPATSAEASARAVAILARTKTTKATYAVYLWNRINRAGEAPREEWSAEFHSGDHHRVETPRDRLVANCRTGEGWAYSVETGTSFDGPWIARTACGIDTNSDFLSAEWQEALATPFGAADRVQLVTSDLVKRYDVSGDGVLLGTVYTDNSRAKTVRLVNCAVALERALPARGMFDRASLARSYVPERYRRPPAAR